MSTIITKFDSSKLGNFELQMYNTARCEDQESVVRNWTSTPIFAPSITNPNSERSTNSTSINPNLEVTQNTVSFKFFNNSNITHTVHYEVFKGVINEPGVTPIFPTINSPHIVVNPQQFSQVITIDQLEENETYTLEVISFFLEKSFSGGSVVFTTDSNIQNPDPSTINQNLLRWTRQPLQIGDVFKINVHSSYWESLYSAPKPENYCNTYYFQNNVTTTVENIANHILERGWLRKRIQTSNGFTFEGWGVTGDKLDAITNVGTSDSNTYNALVELANSLNMNVLFDYNNYRVIFVDRESNALDKNYTLRKGFNIQSYGLGYSGEDMFSIFYVQGGEDELGLITTLSDSVPYKDNFLFNFDYFARNGLVNPGPILNAFENRSNTDSLVNINENLKLLIREETDKLLITRTNKTNFRIYSEAILGGNDPTNQNNTNLSKLFKDRRIINTVDTKAVTPRFTEKWAKANSDYKFDLFFPVKIEYDGVEQIFTADGAAHTVSGVNITLTFISPVGDLEPEEFEYTKNGLTIYGLSAANPSTFDLEKFKVISSDIQYKIDFTFDTVADTYPYFDDLFRYDGIDAINRERQSLQDEVDFTQERWDERYRYQQCLRSIEYNGTLLEDVAIEDINATDLTSDALVVSSAWDNPNSICALEFSLPRFVLEAKTIIGAYEEDIEDFKKGIGEYNPETEEFNQNELGLFNFMLKKFNVAFENYTPLNYSPVVVRLRNEKLRKQHFWYNLKENRQHVFVEGYYENDLETTPQTLKDQAEAIYVEHKGPNENFNITYVDISDIVGVNVDEIQVGDFVRIKDEDSPVAINAESKLKVASISKVLRDKGNISLTIYRYNLINRILERIIKTSGN